MKIQNGISILSVWERKIFEYLPIRTILAIYLIAVLFHLNAIKSDLSSINFCVSGIDARSRGINHSDMGKEAISMFEESTYQRLVAFEVMHKIVSVSKLRDPLRIFEQTTYVQLIEAEIREYPLPEIRQIKNEGRYISESVAKEMGLWEAWNKAAKME